MLPLMYTYKRKNRANLFEIFAIAMLKAKLLHLFPILIVLYVHVVNVRPIQQVSPVYRGYFPIQARFCKTYLT